MENVEVVRTDPIAGVILIGPGAEIPRAGDDGVDGADVAPDRKRDQGFYKCLLFANAALTAVLANHDQFVELSSEIRLEVSDILLPASWVSALTGLELAALGRPLIADLLFVVRHAHPP